jgi:hypothetical protein
MGANEGARSHEVKILGENKLKTSPPKLKK